MTFTQEVFFTLNDYNRTREYLLSHIIYIIMTQELKDRIKAFASEYDANQVCSIFMINHHQLEEILKEKPTKKTPKIDIDPMFTEEEGL